MPHPEHSASLPHDRVVRVFISSTFRDMQAEREELVKRVFPQLRKLCEERGVGFVDVDLRWGVTDEEAAEGKVLPICLAEIDRCRPFFIGLLGERYGWVPQQIPDELAELQPWLAEHREKSVTELEILHGVLNRPEMANRAIFYLRDPEYVDRIPPAQRSDFVEQDPQRRARLEALKGRIRRSGLAVRENYVDPQSLGQWVLQDLTVAINQMFPVTEVPGPLDREAAEHDAFARSRTGVYVGRQEYFDRLNEHGAGDGPPLVILGESGSGKSALLANWALRYRREHPDTLVLMHFIGSSPYSTDWAAMLRRIMGELKRHFGIQQQLPENRDALRVAFANWLHMSAARGRVVLILDALNQLEDHDGAPDLVWLPPVIPDNVRLVLSTLPGRPLDELENRNWPAIEVKLLTPDERKHLIADYLGQYTKHLRLDRAERIASAPQAANPLYLRALLEVLRVFGVHERLDQRIDHYLAADTIPELYNKVLERWEADYERERPGLVRDAMTALWAARRGLTESELLNALDRDGQPLPRAAWSPLFLVMADALVSRGGLLTFAHDFLRRAARDAYLPTNSDQQQAHTRLADYFEYQPAGPRRTDELPWQLAQSGDFERLHDLLRNLEFFKSSFAADPAQIKQYWSLLECKSMRGFRMADAYRSVIENPAAYADVAETVGTLFNETGHWEEYAQLSRGLIDHYRRTGNRERLSIGLANCASLLIRKGAFDEAVPLLTEQREILDRTFDARAMEVWLGTTAMLMYEHGDLSEAWTALEGQEAILCGLGDKGRVAGCLTQKSFILHDRGQHSQALAILHEAMRLAQEVDDLDGRQAVLGEMALNHLKMGEADLALALLEEQADLCRRLGDMESLAGCFGNQAIIYMARGDQQRSLALYQGMEQIGKQIGHSRIQHVGRSGQGQVFFQAAHLDRAEQLLEGIPEFFRAAGMKDPLWRALRLEGGLRLARGNLGLAMDSFTEAVEVCTQVSPPGHVAALLREMSHELLLPPKQNRRVHGFLTLEEFEQKVSWFDQSREQAAKAVELLQRAVLLDPASAETYRLLGIALETLGRNEEAIVAYRRGLALRPGWTDIEVRIADLLLK